MMVDNPYSMLLLHVSVNAGMSASRRAEEVVSCGRF